MTFYYQSVPIGESDIPYNSSANVPTYLLRCIALFSSLITRYGKYWEYIKLFEGTCQGLQLVADLLNSS